MKIRPAFHSLTFAVALLFLLLAHGGVRAQTNGTWNVNADGLWSDTANWLDGFVASGTGATANFTFNINAGRIVTLDSSRAIGTINVGDPTSSFTAYTINSTGDSVLTFANNGSPAQLNRVGGDTGANNIVDTISAPVALQDSLAVTLVNSSTNRSVAITGNISENVAGRSITLSASNPTSGYLLLSGANTFTGGVTINSGELRVGNASNGTSTALGSGTVTLGATSGLANATLAHGRLGNNDSTAIANNVLVQGGSAGTLTISNQGSPSNNNLTLSGTVTLNHDLQLNALNRLTLSGALVGAGPGYTVTSVGGGQHIISGSIGAGVNHLVNDGPGTLSLSGVNTAFTGSVTVQQGSLLLGSGGSSQLNANNVVIVNDGAAFRFSSGGNTVNPTIAGLVDGASGGGSVRIDTSTGARTLTLAGGGIYSFGGTIENGSGTVQLTKDGTGTQTLSGDNSYTGTTIINGGTLLINGDQTLATGNVTVGVNGTLGGIGIVGGATTVNGTISAGLSPGVLTINDDLTITSLGTAIFEAGDLIDANGVLTLNDDWTLELASSPDWQLGGTTTLFTFDSIGGTFDLTPNIVDNTGLGGAPTLSIVGNSVVLNGYSVIPEPGTLGLLSLGLASVLLRRRRK